MPETEDIHTSLKSQIANVRREAEIDSRALRVASEALLTEQQLARRHQRSVKTIRNLRVKGGYVPFLKIGRHVRYRLEDVLEYEEKCLRRSTSDIGRNDDDR